MELERQRQQEEAEPMCMDDLRRQADQLGQKYQSCKNKMDVSSQAKRMSHRRWRRWTESWMSPPLRSRRQCRCTESSKICVRLCVRVKKETKEPEEAWNKDQKRVVEADEARRQIGKVVQEREEHL